MKAEFGDMSVDHSSKHVNFKLFYEETDMDYDEVEKLHNHLGKILANKPELFMFNGEKLTREELVEKKEEIERILCGETKKQLLMIHKKLQHKTRGPKNNE